MYSVDVQCGCTVWMYNVKVGLSLPMYDHDSRCCCFNFFDGGRGIKLEK
jgi:hypothetical protein